VLGSQLEQVDVGVTKYSVLVQEGARPQPRAFREVGEVGGGRAPGKGAPYWVEGV